MVLVKLLQAGTQFTSSATLGTQGLGNVLLQVGLNWNVYGTAVLIQKGIKKALKRELNFAKARQENADIFHFDWKHVNHLNTLLRLT